MSTRQKSAFILNLLIFVLTVFATVSMIIGFEFMGDVKVLSARNFWAFRYFTVDSNVFAALVALAYMVFQLLQKTGRIKAMPRFMGFLKLAAVTGVSLTMLVTVFFLAPRTTTTYFDYFMNSNLFMHLVTPLLCIISFVFFEPAKISFAQSLSGTIPMLLYGLYYIPNILLHLENGKTSYQYDWYGFLSGGVSTVWFVMPLIMLVTWGISVGLWALNKKLAKD